jgi:hypothetical protein
MPVTRSTRETLEGRDRRRDASPTEHSNSELLLLAALVTLAVLVCYRFNWNLLRWWTSELVLRMSGLLAVPMSRLSDDTVSYGGNLFRYTVSCTFIDVFFGAAVLLWNRERRLIENVLALTGFGSCLFVFNLVRLTLGFFLYAHGVSWTLGHEAASGVAYFLVWLWLMRQSNDPIARALERLASRRESASASQALA